MIAEGKNNVIPGITKMEGTLRAFDEEQRAMLKKYARTVARNTARKYHGEIEVEIRDGSPVVINDSDLTCNTASVSLNTWLSQNLITRNP